MVPKPLFCLWWLAENSLVHCLIFHYLLGVTRTDGKRSLPVWLAANGILTFTAIFVRLPGAFLFHVLFLVLFAKVILKIPGPDLIVPMAVITTLCTLKEGFSALFLSWLSVSIRSPTGGAAEQLLVPLLLDFLLFSALRMAQDRYPRPPQRSVPVSPRLLLLPCAFAVVSIRFGFRLDFSDFEPYLASFRVNARWLALLCMTGAAAAVSTALAALGKLIRGSIRENMLLEQLRLQKAYTAEAKKRDAHRAAFQHDIKNHLLVIAGLLREKAFTQAEQYANQLHAASGQLLPGISTGNLTLDVLLGEKLDMARRGQIAVTYTVDIPEGFGVEDTDLCAVFSNILDNAITACENIPPEERFLSLSARTKSQFLVIEAVNAASAGGSITYGTGLTNVRHIAERYQGTMKTELSEGRFQISVLVCSHSTAAETIHETEAAV